MDRTFPLLSIIIPAYNSEQFIGEVIDSALAQDYPAIEVVVANDGSTDGTHAVLASYGDRITVIHQKNGGPASARNNAIAHSRGEYCGLLDADDAWHPKRARRCIEMLEAQRQFGIVTTDAQIIEGTVPSERAYYNNPNLRPFPVPEAQIDAIVAHNFVFIGAVFRREVIDRVGGFDEAHQLRGSEDYDLWCRCILAGERIGLIDEPLASYRVRGDSLSANTSAQWASHVRSLAKNYDAFSRSGAHFSTVTQYAIAKHFEAEGDRRRAARAHIGVARTSPPLSTRHRVALVMKAAWLLVASGRK